ncbi:MAG: bifunctional UDP-N-acetylglucosamine diphosphorylase/glucosamine-1-phosphate N-acetyltransferase GlmU [Sporichthyaceae bacterium]
MSAQPAAVVVLAAGEGTRMKSSVPKVLHPIAGRSLLAHVLAAARTLAPEQVVVVVGAGRELVAAHLSDIEPGASTVVQEQRNGTGHAVRLALAAIPAVNGTLVVLCGDTPLLRGQTLADLLQRHHAAANAATVLTAVLPDPTGYGRIVRDGASGVSAIVEQRDATPEQSAIAEVNSGVYAFDGALLREALARVGTENSQGEEYLTDVIAILRADGHPVGASVAADYHEIGGINDRVQLSVARRLLNERITESWMRAGVTIIDPATTWIDSEVALEPDAVIAPGSQLHGSTRIGAGASIGPNTTLTDTEVGAGARVLSSHATGSVIGPGAEVGPFSYLRPGTRLGVKAKAGAFVEMKNAVVGDASKVPHLSYVGDAVIGAGSNIGAATVFVNYDGIAKHRTVIGDQVRVGSDSMLIAPLTLGDGSYTAAGSVITKDVPPGALAVARGQQRNIEGWVARMRPGSLAADAAAAARAAMQDTGVDLAPGAESRP